MRIFKKRRRRTLKAKLSFNKGEVLKVLGECHDGEDVKIQMKDGSIKIVGKAELN